MANQKTRFRKDVRDMVNGQVITMRLAKHRPRITVVETIPIRWGRRK